MNKGELVDAIANDTGLSKKEAKNALESALDNIKDGMGDDKVVLIGFGTFSVKERAAREGRNPQTGEKIKIAAKKVPFFKPGKALRDAVA